MYGSRLCEPDIIGPITTWSVKANGTNEQPEGREVVRRSTLNQKASYQFNPQ